MSVRPLEFSFRLTVSRSIGRSVGRFLTHSQNFSPLVRRVVSAAGLANWQLAISNWQLGPSLDKLLISSWVRRSVTDSQSICCTGLFALFSILLCARSSIFLPMLTCTILHYTYVPLSVCLSVLLSVGNESAKSCNFHHLHPHVV